MASKCLKMYCECFSKGRPCGECCNCTNCRNVEGSKERGKAMLLMKEKTPNAFDNEIKGCNCKRSNCEKKYCDCFLMGILCTEMCNCVNCRNGKPKKPRARQRSVELRCDESIVKKFKV